MHAGDRERLSTIPDTTQARVNMTDRRVAIEWRDGRVAPERYIERLAELGYKAHPFDAGRSAGNEEREGRMLLRCLGVAAFATMNVMLLSVAIWSGNVSDILPEQRDFFHWLSALIALPAAAYAGRPFYLSAIRAIRAGRVNMDVPISVGVLLALAMSLVETINHATHAYFEFGVDVADLPLGRPRAGTGDAPAHARPLPAISPRCGPRQRRSS